MMDIAFDETLGVLRLVSSGTTSPEELTVFESKALPLLERARTRMRRCLILVDAVNAAVQSQTAVGAFAALTARLQPEDRTAIIIGSTIAKLQSQRIAAKETTAYFSTETDAISWLRAVGD